MRRLGQQGGQDHRVPPGDVRRGHEGVALHPGAHVCLLHGLRRLLRLHQRRVPPRHRERRRWPLCLFVGYDDTQGCWICKNSWGSAWGESGFFRIAYGQCGIEGLAHAVDGIPETGLASGRRNVSEALNVPGLLRERRYVNAVLNELTSEDLLSRVDSGQTFRLRLDIGELGQTHVTEPEPFPDAGQREDLWIDVMLSSSDYSVGRHVERLVQGTGAHGRFFLPTNRTEPAISDDGSRYLFFVLRAPTEGLEAHARISFYYRDALVQSLLLTADLSDPARHRNFRIDNDFTVSAGFEYLEEIIDRPRISVLVNDNGSGGHQLTYRARGNGHTLDSASFEVPQADAAIVRRLRRALTDRAPERRSRKREELISDLQALAPLGWQMYTAFKPGLEKILHQMRNRPQDVVVSIARPFTSTFTLPWALVYDIFLDSALLDRPSTIPVCPLVRDWEESQDLISGGPRRCPINNVVEHKNLLCPFGFWVSAIASSSSQAQIVL
jgi:hypothetical protein